MFVPDPGSRIRIFSIPDPWSWVNIFCILDPWSRIWIFSIPDPGSRMRIKEFKYFNQKKWFLSSQKYDRSFWSWIRLPDLDPDFLPVPDPDPGSQIPNPGIKKALDPWSRIPDPDLQHWRFWVCSGCRGYRWLLTFNGRCCLNNSFNGSVLRSFYEQKRILRIFYFHIISLIFTLFKLWCPAHLFPNTPRIAPIPCPNRCKFVLTKLQTPYIYNLLHKSGLSSFSVGCKLAISRLIQLAKNLIIIDSYVLYTSAVLYIKQKTYNS